MPAWPECQRAHVGENYKMFEKVKAIFSGIQLLITKYSCLFSIALIMNSPHCFCFVQCFSLKRLLFYKHMQIY